MAAWNTLLDFATEIGAITEEAAAEISVRVWKALLELGTEQSALQEESSPVAKFRDLILAALQGGCAHLLSLSNDANDPPLNAGAWGWIERSSGNTGEVISTPNGSHIGWVDDEHLYLIPALAFDVVNKLSTGGFGVGPSQARSRAGQREGEPAHRDAGWPAASRLETTHEVRTCLQPNSSLGHDTYT